VLPARGHVGRDDSLLGTATSPGAAAHRRHVRGVADGTSTASRGRRDPVFRRLVVARRHLLTLLLWVTLPLW
jgi:hypothetical protein